MNLYTQLRNSQQKRVDDFLNKYAFFAFSEEQFKDGLRRLGISEDAKKALAPLGTTGGYILRERAEDYRTLAEQLQAETEAALADPATGAQFAYDMFYFELCNHEYSYTGDISETLDALGYTPEEIRDNEQLQTALRKACEDALKN